MVALVGPKVAEDVGEDLVGGFGFNQGIVTGLVGAGDGNADIEVAHDKDAEDFEDQAGLGKEGEACAEAEKAQGEVEDFCSVELHPALAFGQFVDFCGEGDEVLFGEEFVWFHVVFRV